jgi:hypothetical protein
VTIAPPFKFGSVAFSAYLPALLFCIGEGAVIPIVPIIAQQQGASIGMAALIASMLMLGQLIGDLPAGILVRRVGERWAMVGAAAVAIIGLVISCSTGFPVLLAAGMLIVGSATAVLALTRHAYLTVAVPIQYRARALSTLGGIFRAGYFIGPFLSAWLHEGGRESAGVPSAQSLLPAGDRPSRDAAARPRGALDAGPRPKGGQQHRRDPDQSPRSPLAVRRRGLPNRRPADLAHRSSAHGRITDRHPRLAGGAHHRVCQRQ